MRKKYYCNKSNYNHFSRSKCVLLVGIPFIISLLLLIAICSLYKKFQCMKFSNDNTLLFVNDNMLILLFGVLSIIIMILMISIIKNNFSTKFKKVKIYFFIIIIGSIISALFVIGGFFVYTDINNEGIYVSNGIFSKSKNYKWNDVTFVEVSYEHSYRNKIKISYDIYLEDGEIIHTNDAEYFFRDIVNLDNFMKSKNIRINRKKILNNDYNNFKYSYGKPGKYTDDRLKIVLELFNG